MALAHKGLDVETIPWRFTEKDRIAPATTVPVLVDGDKRIADSWAIVNYLEDRYPDRPSLFGGAAGRALTRFYVDWANVMVASSIARLVLVDIFDHLASQDRDYFRRTREQRFGMTLEAAMADRDQRLPAFRDSLNPMRLVLKHQKFLGGNEPLQADYTVFGCFQWARCISAFRLLEESDPVAAWRETLLDRFEGLARKAPGYPV